MKYLVLSFLVFLPLLSFSQNDCPNRESFELIVKVDQEGFYQQQINMSPYFVNQGILQLYPGEKVFVETEINNDKIINLKTVKKVIHPEKTIEIEFKQAVNGKVHENMILTVNNPFDKELKYSALIYILNHSKWVETSIIPVFPKLL